MSEPTDDELRAEQYQRNVFLQHARNREREAALHGDPSAREALRRAWLPLDLWLRERQSQSMPTCDEED